MATKKTTPAKNDKAPKTTKPANAAPDTTKPAAPAKPPKKEAAAKDALGCRVGSQSSAINKCITDTPKDVATLVGESGCTAARIRNHLRFLLAKEVIVQTDDGYSTPPTTPAKRTRKGAK